jgi:tetratricopeptide (TPR) repeat protein
MSDTHLGDTQPLPAVPSPPGKPRRQFPWRNLLGLLLLIGLGLLGGYASGMQARSGAASGQQSVYLQEQFELGLQDLEAGRYDLARQRFEEIIRRDPNYPGAQEKLTEALLKLSVTPTPLFTPTPAVTATPDTRAAEAIYELARTQLAAQDWDAVITSLEELRRKDATYRVVDVDGMYYVALRGRGVDKILKEGQPEPGIYDLTLAEFFGPLDGYADGLRTGARLYLTAASFWEIDWANAVLYFAQVYQSWPGLWDSASGMTTTERYRIALVKYADQLALAGDYCRAEEHYYLSLTIRDDANVAPTAFHVGDLCRPATATPQPSPTPDGTETPTPTPTPNNDGGGGGGG